MKIGIYGGTFNPVHNGHITAARAAVKALGLDKLLLLPANVPPHKTLPEGSASPTQRLEMAELAAGAVGKLAQADGIELQRTGKSYTSDSLRLLRQQYPEDELWLLMGSDMFLSLHRWHEPEVICALAHIGAFHRMDGDADEGFAAQKQLLERQFGARVAIIDNEEIIPISSTQVREALARGEGEKLVPTAVWGYIRRCHLYGTALDLTRLTPDELRPIAMSYLKPKRMPHVLGTEQEAVRLTQRYGGDEQEARIAALLHDCTKKLDMAEQLALCAAYGLTLDDLEGTFFASKYYILREFKKYTGLSVHQYMIIRRVMLAQELIGQGVKPREACIQCGFTDYSSFYRAFKARTGLSPEQFRSQNSK